MKYIAVVLVFWGLASFDSGVAYAPTELVEDALILINNNSVIAKTILPLKFQVLATLGEEITKRESSNNPKVCNRQYGCKAGMGLWGFIETTWNDTLDKMTCSGRYDQDGCTKVFLPENCCEKVSSKEQNLIPEILRDHPIFDDKGGCSDLVGMWLLENEGLRHWESEDGSWGSGPYPDLVW